MFKPLLKLHFKPAIIESWSKLLLSVPENFICLFARARNSNSLDQNIYVVHKFAERGDLFFFVDKIEQVSFSKP